MVSSHSDPVGLVVVGLGAVGRGVLAAALVDGRFDVVAAVESSSDRKLLARRAGFHGAVGAGVEGLPANAEVAVVCTGSTTADISPLAIELLGCGLDVVSTCEELIAPSRAGAGTVAALDRAALAAGRSVVGTGVNPGFAMDLLPAVLTMASREIRQMRIVRRVDVMKRREQLRAKVGVGITPDAFRARRREGSIGHVGLRSSLTFLAGCIGWVGRSDETLEPVLDPDGGRCRGVRHVAEVRDRDDVVRVRGVLEMYAGAVDLDRIEIDGKPSLGVELSGGLPGDEATVSAVVNVAAAVRGMRPGLRTAADFFPPIWRDVVA